MATKNKEHRFSASITLSWRNAYTFIVLHKGCVFRYEQFFFLVLFVGVLFEKEFEKSMANTQLSCLCFCFTKAVGH